MEKNENWEEWRMKVNEAWKWMKNEGDWRMEENEEWRWLKNGGEWRMEEKKGIKENKG